MKQPFVNGRFLHQRMTGVQRYGREILNGFDRGGYSYTLLEPGALYAKNKLSQHLWEQFLLPGKINFESTLWSPANSGPLSAPNHIITFHDVGIFPHPEWFSTSYGIWKKNLIPRLAGRARKIITVSRFSKQVICAHLNVSPDKVAVVYNGVDRQRFHPAKSSDIRKVTEKYSITQPYLLALGSMDPRKNFQGLISAWNKCVEEERLNKYRLVIAGGHNVNFRQFNVNPASPGVMMLGYVDDHELAPLYSGADGFLFPSLFEGFGLPVIEAMACGTPVLTSATTALQEVAGDAAITVDPEDTEAIKRGIMKLIDSPMLRYSLVERGFERIKRFDWNKAATRTYKHLTS